MACASVAHEDSLLLYRVAALSMGSAWIDGVLVVETPADRIAFDDLITHLDLDRIVDLQQPLGRDKLRGVGE